MKGAIVLILMLCLGFITAQSIDATGYELSKKDTIYIQNIISTIERKGIDVNTTEIKFAPYLNYFPSNSRQHKLLHEIYTHILSSKDTPNQLEIIEEKSLSQELIYLLGEQF